MSCRTLSWLECATDGKVLANSGICPQCKQQLYVVKPLTTHHVINGRRQKHNNKLRGVDRF